MSGDWERSIVRSIDGKMAEEKKNRRYVFFLPNHIHLSLIGTNLEQRTNC